jgi:hypothetical protein
MPRTLSSELFQDLRSATERELSAGAGPDRQGTIGLPGAEVVLSFLAAKILIPVVCAFIKDVAFEQYKKINSRAEAARARDALAGQTLQSEPVVPIENIIKEVKPHLVAEGLSEDTADRAIRRAFERVRQTVGTPAQTSRAKPSSTEGTHLP